MSRPSYLVCFTHVRQAVHDVGLTLLSFVLYWSAYQGHELLMPYVSYAQGVDLLFLPAGIKLVMIMVAGWRGALGCGLALLTVAPRFWPEQDLAVLALYSALSVGVTYLVIEWLLRRRGLPQTLQGLSFWDIVVVDAFNTVLHGITVNLYFWLCGLRSADQLWSATLAMALGDFLGTGVALLLVLLAAQVLVPSRR
jgi:hypothetical protein